MYKDDSHLVQNLCLRLWLGPKTQDVIELKYYIILLEGNLLRRGIFNGEIPSRKSSIKTPEDMQ